MMKTKHNPSVELKSFDTSLNQPIKIFKKGLKDERSENSWEALYLPLYGLRLLQNKYLEYCAAIE